MVTKKVRLIAAVLLIVSYFLPWAKDGLLGIVSVSPYEVLGRSGALGGGGVLLLALPVAGALALWRPHHRLIGVAGGAVAFVLTLLTLIRTMSHEFVVTQFGAWLALVAAAALAVASFRQDGRRTAEAGMSGMGTPAVRRLAEAAAGQDLPARNASSCPACGTPVKDDFKFCGQCGTPLSH